MIPLKGTEPVFLAVYRYGTISFTGVVAGPSLPGISILNELIIYFFATDSRP